MGNWKEAKRIREGVVIDGKYNCGFTDKSRWQAFIHVLKNSSHKMVKNW